jgi:outer membrane protein assembly factor BamB
MIRLFTLLACLLLAIQAGAQNRPFRFIHITDTHLTALGNIEPLKKLVADIQAMPEKPAFVVDTGDVTEAGKPEEYARFQEGTAGLSVPFYCAPGNHDTRWGPLGKEAFTNAFKKLYQSFDVGGVHFVVLDSTVLLEHWGHFDSAQMKWLAADLKKMKKETPVVLFFHHWLGREKAMIDNEEALLRLIAPYNVVAMMVGHGHSDIQWKVNGIQCFMARGLYQGSYHVVEVDDRELKVLRVRKEDAGKAATVVATIPRNPGPRYHVEFLWGDPDIPLLERRRPLVELQFGTRGAHDDRVKAAYSLDGGPQKPMERDVRDRESVSFMTEFQTKGMTAGSHTLRFYLTAPDGEVYRRDESFTVERLSGLPKREWQFAAGDVIQSSPALVGDTLYTTSFDGKVYALNTKNGDRRWTATTRGSIYSSPVVVDGTLYVGSMDHYFYAFDAKSGHQKWKYDAGTPIFASAAVSNGTVCFGADKKIVGLDVTTGKERWTQTAGSFFQSRAATSDGVFYLGGWDNTLYALDAVSGTPKWTAKMGRSQGGKGAISFYYSPAIASPAVSGGRVYVCTNDGTLHAVNAKTGKDDWTARAPQGGDSLGHSSPLFADGKIFVGGLGSNGDCYAFDAPTGEMLWRCSTGAENYDSSPALCGESVVIGSVQGRLSWIDGRSGKVTQQYTLDPGHSFSTPASSDRLTYATSMNNTVYSISLP